MTNKTLECLDEAYRRFEEFSVRVDSYKWNLNDLQKAWTGLGFQTEYKDAWKAGLMKPVIKPQPRCKAWWRLTEKGAKIILQKHQSKAWDN